MNDLQAVRFLWLLQNEVHDDDDGRRLTMKIHKHSLVLPHKIEANG